MTLDCSGYLQIWRDVIGGESVDEWWCGGGAGADSRESSLQRKVFSQ
jgi:hypothetical protein